MIFRNLKKNKDEWNAKSFGSDSFDFEAVIKTKDPNILADLLWDLQRLGYPMKSAIEKFKKLQEDEPELFFLR